MSLNYQTFLKFSEKQVQNFNNFCIKFTQILFIIYPSFSKKFLKFLKFPQSFSKYFYNFFSKFQQILLKTNISNFHYILSKVPQSIIDILSSFFANFSNYFQRFAQRLEPVIVEVCLNFYSSLLKNFLPSFRSVLKFFLTFK